MNQFSRRALLVAAALGATGLIRPVLAANPVFFHNEGCGCCHKWADHMKEAGLAVTLQATGDLSGEHARHGVPSTLETCHVGRINGYVISGHVPAADIKRLLAEKPAALGLVVPGMPTGSPGMEFEGQVEPYEVLLLSRDGSTSVFAKHS